jgi:hypothetical protein
MDNKKLTKKTKKIVKSSIKYTNLRKLYTYTRALYLSSREHIEDEYNKICSKYPLDPIIISKKKRIIVFGDIHGDYKLTIDLLLISKVAEIIGYKKNNKTVMKKFSQNDVEISDDVEYIFKWTGKDTYVVQVGDQIDRCRPYDDKVCNDPSTILNDEDSDIKILKLFTELNKQAHKEEGAVISLFGNHELLNSLGVMDYVSYKNLQHFHGEKGRIKEFKPGNNMATFMGCTRNSCVIIGSHMFVHAGIINKLIDQINIGNVTDLEKINMLIKKWLLGLVESKYVLDLVRSQDSMFWTRILGSLDPNLPLSNPDCNDNISKVLKLFKINGMIIGHTPQTFIHNKEINSTCGKKIWRVDIGSSSAFDIFDLILQDNKDNKDDKKNTNRRAQYLEIIDDSKYFICDEERCSEKK